MKLKKFMALTFLCSLIVSTLGGCGGNGQESIKPGADQDNRGSTQETDAAVDSKDQQETSAGIFFPLEDPVTLKAFVCTADGNQYTMNDSLFWKYMEERTNVHWEFIEVPYAELPEKKELF